jgi:hypothetical protein
MGGGIVLQAWQLEEPVWGLRYRNADKHSASQADEFLESIAWAKLHGQNSTMRKGEGGRRVGRWVLRYHTTIFLQLVSSAYRRMSNKRGQEC